jgi:hypothetical protein
MRAAASENPFYGKIQLFEFYQAAQSGKITDSLLTSTWKTCKTKEDKELFWVIAFSCGDISNRQHNAFKGKVDNGGSAHRAAFQSILKWAKKNTPKQYERFLTSDAIRQYTTLDNILGIRVKTQQGKKTIIESVNFLEGTDMQMVAQYIAGIIQKGNAMDNQLVAKFLTNVRTSKRQKVDKKTKEKSGQRELQPATKENMKVKQQFYVHLSEAMGWSYAKKDGWIDFIGLKAWKAKNNVDLESVLFSTGKIKEYDETQFMDFLEKLPSGARFRVRCRLLTKENGLKGKWINKFGKDLGLVFLEWEKRKELLQDEHRKLTEKVRQGVATDDEKIMLAKVAKSAKVNTGGATLFDELDALLTSAKTPREIDLQIQSILDKVNFDVPVLTIVDCSGSMGGGWTAIKGKNGATIPPYKVAAFLATVAMLKNPSNEVDDLLIRFGTYCDILTDGASGVKKTNRFMQGTTTKVSHLIDRTKPFSTNFENIQSLINCGHGGTDLSTVPKAFSKWIESDPDTRQHKIEQLQRYPVFMVISDGDLNSSSTAATSMLQFRREMAKYGWDGVVVVWDVNSGTPENNKFADVPNTLHLMGWNIGIINQVFTKIHDLDIIDTYLPLKSLYESNRYDLVKANVI